MNKNNNLNKKTAKKEILSPEVKEQLAELYAMLEDRYGPGFADSVMRPYLAAYDQTWQ